VIDFEHSSASYGGTGARRIDARHELRRIIDNRPIQPIDIYLWFRSFISKIKPDEYDCLVVDPISDVESGLTEYVRRNPAEFGYSENQFKNAAGLLFGAVKERWKIDLAAIGSVVQTFYYTVHLRMQFRDGKPTGIMEPKGKTTLEELSSLYLWLHRDPDANGVVAPVPYADIIKQRLSDTFIDPNTGEVVIQNLIPPRLPQATAAAIRKYIANPPDYNNLKEEERYKPKQLSQEEMLLLERSVAQTKLEAEMTQL
jgi:hypothetical protein